MHRRRRTDGALRRHTSRWLVVTALLGGAAMLALTASANACPNEALRSELSSGQLPDCRAYELVSPVYKQGAFVSPFAVSPEGTRVIAGSLGVFGDAEGDTLGQGTHVPGAAYEFIRDTSGWVTASLGPPRSLFFSNGLFDASADLDSTLWELGRRRVSSPGVPEEATECPALPGEEETQPEGVTGFYLERPIGVFTKIGRATPAPCTVNATQYKYLGASKDLSRVLFSASPGVRWPFDETQGEGSTLYEYTGVEQPDEARVPTMVGVEGSVGSSKLISRCGTRLGSSSLENGVHGSVYNAISAGGARIFFTAVGTDEAGGCEGPPVGELFAREELPLVGGELPPANMATVPLSEPGMEASGGEACGACLKGEELRNAVFQGASLDGSKVFFSTEQRLLPGAEGMNLYEYDFDPTAAGNRVTLVSGGAGDPELQGVARISEDGSRAYFVAKNRLTVTPNGVGSSAVAGEDNLYVYREGNTSFVATLLAADARAWAPADDRPVLASSTGEFVVFTSVADLTGEGAMGVQVFQYDAATGVLVRASIGQNGYNKDGRASVAGSTISNGFPAGYSYAGTDSPTTANSAQAPANGAVFFSSPDALTSHALGDQRDFLEQLVPNVYEYRNGQVHLLSDGQDAFAVNSGPSVELAGSDPSGGDVFFLTADPLIASDGDTQQDLYDAHVEGGFSTSSFTSACSGESCRGALAAAPPLSPLGGSATEGAEAEASAVVISTLPKAKAKVKAKRKKPRIAKRRKTHIGRKARKAASHGHPGLTGRVR